MSTIKNKILVATSNNNKLNEIKDIFREFEIIGLEDYYVAPEETGSTFCENAFIKATNIENLNDIILADDSGIEVEALNGAPGVYSARYSGGNDYDNNKKLLKALENETNRKARFVCCMVAIVRKQVLMEEATLEGNIGFELKGESGFGYDKIFIPIGYDKTLAELGQDIKNQISHRKKALEGIKYKIMKFISVISTN
jgi:XTP/dITP diphosphohydrolase